MGNETGSNLPEPTNGEDSVHYRADLAWEFRAQGMSLYEIAQELDTTQQSVVALLRERFGADAAFMTKDGRGMLLALELHRLDRLIKAHWGSAMLADPKSTDAVLKAIQLRMRLAKLDEPDADDNTTRVLVISGAEVDYVEKLKELVNEDE